MSLLRCVEPWLLMMLSGKKNLECERLQSACKLDARGSEVVSELAPRSRTSRRAELCGSWERSAA